MCNCGCKTRKCKGWTEEEIKEGIIANLNCNETMAQKKIKVDNKRLDKRSVKELYDLVNRFNIDKKRLIFKQENL